MKSLIKGAAGFVGSGQAFKAGAGHAVAATKMPQAETIGVGEMNIYDLIWNDCGKSAPDYVFHLAVQSSVAAVSALL